MSYVESSVVVSRRGPSCVGGDPLRTVVWVRGEYDIANRGVLSATIAEAACLDDSQIVVDLSGVDFMDASTIGVLVVAGNRLGAPCRSLTVRDPSLRARRLLELCGLGGLIEDRATPAEPPVAAALGSWVDVPASQAGVDVAQQPAGDPEECRDARVTVRRRLELAGPLERRRARW